MTKTCHSGQKVPIVFALHGVLHAVYLKKNAGEMKSNVHELCINHYRHGIPMLIKMQELCAAS